MKPMRHALPWIALPALIALGIVVLVPTGCGGPVSPVGKWKAEDSEGGVSDGYTLKTDGTFEAWTTTNKPGGVEAQNRGTWKKDGDIYRLSITGVLEETGKWKDVTDLKIAPYSMVFSGSDHATIIKGTLRDEYVRDRS